MDIALDLDKMIAGEPDMDALRSLFSELEFTTLLKELVPVMEVRETEYRELTIGERADGAGQGKRPAGDSFRIHSRSQAED